jgi:hypothetical protein
LICTHYLQACTDQWNSQATTSAGEIENATTSFARSPHVETF